MITREDGISLIEIVVALLLLTVALMGLAIAFPQGRHAVHTGSQIGTAANLARQTLEAMRNRQYTTTVDEITAANFPNEAYGAIPNFPTFRRVVTIQDGAPEAACTPPPPTPCTKLVTVSVFYRDETGQERDVALRNIFVR
jgi:Tfp pilus assembly protein PilV